MPALTTRAEARNCLMAEFQKQLDALIPCDETVPAGGTTFLDFEMKTAARNRVNCAAVEEMVKLSDSASAESAGVYPYCDSTKTRLRNERRDGKRFHRRGRSNTSNRRPGATVAGALFPSQHRDLALPSEVPLTPLAHEKVCRECAQHSYDIAARNITIEWGVTLDGKQMQLANAAGEHTIEERDREVTAMESGSPPAPSKPESAPKLMVIGVDGGTVQTTEKNPETGSRWKGTKVCTVTTYDPGDGAGIQPQKLVTTMVSSTGGPDAIGQLLRCEAERRNLTLADVLLVIADWYHACENISNSARAATVDNPSAYLALREKWESWLWDGQFDLLLAELKTASEKAGAPQQNDPANLPRVVLRRDVGYFTNNRAHMDYPEYRRNGWSIGSGNIESAVKQIGLRIKGSDKFWHINNAEKIMALREKWLSEDGRWERYWAFRPAYLKTSA